MGLRPAWTTLYALIAVASARTLDRIDDPAERNRYRFALAANLVLNIGWSSIFFRAHRPRLALAEMLALEASTVDLIICSVRHDRAAAECSPRMPAGWPSRRRSPPQSHRTIRPGRSCGSLSWGRQPTLISSRSRRSAGLRVLVSSRVRVLLARSGARAG